MVRFPLLSKLKQWIRADKAARAKRIMKKYNTQLTKAAMRKSGAGSSLACSLCNENFVHNRYFMDMINRANPELEMVYASTIISAVRRVVYSDPESFPSIVAILKRHDFVSSVARKMEKEYYDDDDTVLKVSVVGSTSLCMFGVVVLVLTLIVYYYVTYSTVCLKLTKKVQQDILLTLSAPSYRESEIDTTFDIKCRELFNLYSTTNNDPFVSCNVSKAEAGPVKYNASCIGETIVMMETGEQSSCVELLEPFLNCLGVKLNVTELAERTSNNQSNHTLYHVSTDKTDL